MKVSSVDDQRYQSLSIILLKPLNSANVSIPLSMYADRWRQRCFITRCVSLLRPSTSNNNVLRWEKHGLAIAAVRLAHSCGVSLEDSSSTGSQNWICSRTGALMCSRMTVMHVIVKREQPGIEMDVLDDANSIRRDLSPLSASKAPSLT
jgi:hypothetical protein